MRRPPLVLGVSLHIAALVVVYACGDLDPPPSPTTSRIATIIGQVTGFAPDGVGYVLDDGRVVDLTGRGSSGPVATLLSATIVSMPSASAPGGLLLFGEDELGGFYAATMPPDEHACFRLLGTGYIGVEDLHLSSGLELPLDRDVDLIRERDQLDPSWLLGSDHVCLDEDGTVTSIRQLALGV